jgi:hypothetical protein
LSLDLTERAALPLLLLVIVDQKATFAQAGFDVPNIPEAAAARLAL